MKKLLFARYFPKNRKRQQEQRRCIACSPVIIIMNQGSNMTMLRLIFCEGFQYSLTTLDQLRIPRNSNAKYRKHQIPGIWLRISPTGRARQTLVWAFHVMKKDFERGLAGFFNCWAKGGC